MLIAPPEKLRLTAYLGVLLPPFAPVASVYVASHRLGAEAEGVLHVPDPRVIRPFRAAAQVNH